MIRGPAILSDLAAALISFPLAAFLVSLDSDGPGPLSPDDMALWSGLFGAIVLFFTWAFDLDRSLWRFTTVAELLRVVEAATLAILVFSLVLFVTGGFAAVPRALPVVQGLILVACLCGARIAAAALGRLRRPRPAHHDWVPIVLIGAGENADMLVQLMEDAEPSPWAAVGILDDRPAYRGRAIRQVPVLGRLEELREVTARLAMHGIAVRMAVLGQPIGSYAPASLERLHEAAEGLDLPICDATDFVRLYANRLREPARPEAAPPPAGGGAKRAIDIAVAATLLALTLPVTLVVALLVAVCLGRPVVFGQVRPGHGMRPITVLKFRTMRFGHSLSGDLAPDRERMTGLGRFLRRTRLDELPQLWNVLKGDMALIGPRPLLPKDLPDLRDLLHERFSMRPGITGWAQINGGDRLSPEEKLAFDLWYIRNQSLLLDLQIVALTLWTMLVGDEARLQGREAGFGDLLRRLAWRLEPRR